MGTPVPTRVDDMSKRANLILLIVEVLLVKAYIRVAFVNRTPPRSVNCPRLVINNIPYFVKVCILCCCRLC